LLVHPAITKLGFKLRESSAVLRRAFIGGAADGITAACRFRPDTTYQQFIDELIKVFEEVFDGMR
jgi:hypothetical protein